jgi:hypothetical protein
VERTFGPDAATSRYERQQGKAQRIDLRDFSEIEFDALPLLERGGNLAVRRVGPPLV